MTTRFVAGLALLVLYGTTGCAANQSALTPTRSRPQTDVGRAGSAAVRVTSAHRDQPIAIDIEGRPPGPVKSALLGAFIGAGAPIALGIGAGIAVGPLAGIPIAAGVLIAPVTATMGAVAGARAPSPDTWDKEAQVARTIGTPSRVNDTLRDRVVAIAQVRPNMPDVAVYDPAQHDVCTAMLEVAVDEISLTEGGRRNNDRKKVSFLENRGNESLGFTMRARARLVRSSDGVEMYGRAFGFVGRDLRSLHAWAADNAALFVAEVDRAYTVIATKIVDDMLARTDQRIIDEDEAGIDVPPRLRDAVLEALEDEYDLFPWPSTRQVRYRFVRHDPGHRFMWFMRIHTSFTVMARVVEDGHELGAVEAVATTGEVLYPDPLRPAARRAAANIAAYVRALRGNVEDVRSQLRAPRDANVETPF